MLSAADSMEPEPGRAATAHLGGAPGARKLLVIFSTFWFAALLGGSLLPWSAKAYFHTFAHSHSAFVLDFHRLLHFATFATTTFIVFIGTRRWWLAAGLSFFVGCLTEYLERIVYLGWLEWADIRDDGLGVLAGLGAIAIFCHWRGTWQHRQRD